MSTGTGIEWTDATWNPVSGCAPVSAGCANCYAKGVTRRLEQMGQAKYAGLTVLQPNGARHFNGVVRCHEEALAIPLAWRKPRRIFVNSMSDLFYGTERDRAYHRAHTPAGTPFEPVPFEFIDRVFAVMALCPQHTFQLLTKRPERMAEYLNNAFEINEWANLLTMCDRMKPGLLMDDTVDTWTTGGARWHMPNVWLGTSCEDQKAADERIPHLCRCPAAVRFLSCEPLLGEIDLRAWLHPKAVEITASPSGATHRDVSCSLIHWVIVGGESGGGARPCNVEWVRSIARQCKAAGVPCFVKQLRTSSARSRSGTTACATAASSRTGSRTGGSATLRGGDMSEWPEDLRVREMPGEGSQAQRHEGTKGVARA